LTRLNCYGHSSDFTRCSLAVNGNTRSRVSAGSTVSQTSTRLAENHEYMCISAGLDYTILYISSLCYSDRHSTSSLLSSPPPARVGGDSDLIPSCRINYTVSRGRHRRCCIGDAMHPLAGSGYWFNMHFLFKRLPQRRIFGQPKNSQYLKSSSLLRFYLRHGGLVASAEPVNRHHGIGRDFLGRPRACSCGPRKCLSSLAPSG
jgi:hypothetical protein